MTSYLRSVATMDPSRTACDIIGNFGQKLHFFLATVYLTFPLSRFLSELVKPDGVKKLE